jgi:hypothetical protein
MMDIGESLSDWWEMALLKFSQLLKRLKEIHEKEE